MTEPLNQKNPSHKLLKDLMRIRIVEQTFLDLFSLGLMNGTVHTCIGQELSALAFAGQLKKTDFVFSNHRCHGHYIAYTRDWKGLILELMGKKDGVCGGIGSSQHLQERNFYSNGIQGGIMPLAAGFALGNKFLGNDEIGIVYIGDGTLGEGVVYETLNFISKKEVPLLVVCENNLYAQSTLGSETRAGSFEGRAKAFDIEFRDSHTFDGDLQIFKDAKSSIDDVRKFGKPIFHLVNTYRLKAHSKGDDDRSSEEINSYEKRDYLSIFQSRDPEYFDRIYTTIKKEVDDFVEFAKVQSEQKIQEYLKDHELKQIELKREKLTNFSSSRLVSRINSSLNRILEDERVILIGEDISDPYGGAFKVTKGLGQKFGERIISTTISEGLIAGIANGLSLRGMKPFAEFMFGDFTALAFDQMINHAAKIYYMYNHKVTSGVVFRTPMGGGRGYGPTHSQSLEKHFIGMETFAIFALNRIMDPEIIYQAANARIHPTLIIENKVEYAKNGELTLPIGFEAYSIETATIPIITIEPEEKPTSAIITYGGFLDHSIESVEKLITANDKIPKIILISQLDPIQEELYVLIEDCEEIIFIEEGIEGGTVGDYYISKIAQKNTAFKSYKNISSKRVSIPSVKSLEKEVLANFKEVISN